MDHVKHVKRNGIIELQLTKLKNKVTIYISTILMSILMLSSPAAACTDIYSFMDNLSQGSLKSFKESPFFSVYKNEKAGQYIGLFIHLTQSLSEEEKEFILQSDTVTTAIVKQSAQNVIFFSKGNCVTSVIVAPSSLLKTLEQSVNNIRVISN